MAKNCITNKQDEIPFELVLEDNPDSVLCYERVRFVPKKRSVYFARWKDQEVVAKIFYEKSRARHHWRKEIKGLSALMDANIPTPARLFEGKIQHKRQYVIIFERIIEAKSLKTLWKEKPPYITRLLQAVTVELATQHVLGIEQKDLHLDNFLILKKTIFTLDGGNIVAHKNLLSKQQSLLNLALFFSQLGTGIKQLQQDLFNVYAKSRGWLVKDKDKRLLETNVKIITNHRLHQFNKKIFRNCSAFKKISTAKQTCIIDRDYSTKDFEDFLKKPDEIFLKPDSVWLKKGRSASVIKFTYQNREFVLKRYNIKNILHKISRAFRQTRAAHAWRLSQYLCLLGISTPKPIAFIENHFMGIKDKSYFLSEYIHGQSLEAVFATYSKKNTDQLLIAHRVIHLIKQLSEVRITHGDLKKTNILIAKLHPFLIDLDGMKEHYFLIQFTQALKKDMNRFLKNWIAQPEVLALYKKILF